MASDRKARESDAFARHKKLMNDYYKTPRSHKTELDIIRENHKFIRNEEDDEDDASWEQRVAKKYYDKLFKEYAICELKYYRDGKIALRWRTEREVVSGKGQFTCASTRCEDTKGLKSWEVNFGYKEDGEKKNELVKVRLCRSCSDKLNYKTQKRLAKREKKQERKRSKATDDEGEEDHTHKKKKRRDTSRDRQESEAEESPDERSSADNPPNVWSRPLNSKDEKSKEEEFEDYFADLLQ